MKRRSEGDTKGFLSYADEASFSTDFKTNPTSFTSDSTAGSMLDPIFVKVVCWYDTSGATLAALWTLSVPKSRQLVPTQLQVVSSCWQTPIPTLRRRAQAGMPMAQDQG